MSENKSVVTVAVASVGVLSVVCVVLFCVAWSSLTTVTELREENNRLVLQGTVCKMRLETALSERHLPMAPSAPAYAANEAQPQTAKLAPTEGKPGVATLNVPATAHEPKAKVVLEKVKSIFKKEGAATAAVKAETQIAKPAVKATPEPMPESVPQKAPEAPVAQADAQVAAALSAKAEAEIAQKPSTLARLEAKGQPTKTAVAEDSAQTPAGKIEGAKPELTSIDAHKKVWALQAGAYMTRTSAKRAAKIVSGYLKDAELDYPVVVGKGTRDTFWKIFVAPTNVRDEVDAVRQTFSQAIAVPVIVARVPKTVARTLVQ